MPPSPDRIHTKYGDIFAPTGPCRDNYPNITAFHDKGGQIVELQDPALRSFRECERVFGGWRPWKHRTKRIALTGSLRTCALQTQLHNQDPNRFADPDTSLHPRGLAIDVSQDQRRLRKIRKLLLQHGWEQARPTDEPWHFSYYLKA